MIKINQTSSSKLQLYFVLLDSIKQNFYKIYKQVNTIFLIKPTVNRKGKPIC